MNESRSASPAPTGPKVVVYAGPTISADDIRFVLPSAVVRPPAARGDLLAESWHPGDVAVVIDGYFRERRSVGHKEILRVLADGAAVIGTASMGALRAMELAPCGMRGLGACQHQCGQRDGADVRGCLFHVVHPSGWMRDLTNTASPKESD